MPDQSIEPVSYRDIQDAYNQLQASGHPAVKGMSMHDYATALNTQTNSNAYDAGLNPNIVKDASAGVDRLLDASGVTDVTGGLGRALGGMISPEAAQTGEQFGRGIVRPVVAGAAGALAGTLIGGPLGGVAGAEEGAEAGGVSEAAQLAKHAWSLFGSNTGYGANQALQTYTDTDSVPAAAVSGALGYLTHGFGQVGEATAAKLLGSKIGSVAVGDGTRASVEGVMPTLAEMATEKFGLTAGYTVNNELTRQAVNVALGRGLSIPTTGEAVSDVAQAAAPLILGIGHDIMGVHAALQPDRDVRSISESMNIVQAAQKIATDKIKEDVQQAAIAAESTLADIKKADGLRAGAQPTEEEISGQVLNEEDKKAYADSYLRDSTTPDEQLAQSPSKTFAGKPLSELGQPAAPELSAPIDRNAQGIEATPPVSNEQTQTQTPAADQSGSTTSTDKQTPASVPEKTASSSQPVEQPTATKQYQRPIKPEPLTLDGVIEKAKLLNSLPKDVSLNSFAKLVDLYTEFQRQLMDYPELRDQITIHPLSDKYFLAQVTHLMSPEGGSMKSGPALTQVLQAAKNHLADKLTEFAAKKPVIEQTRLAENAKLRAQNEAKFSAEQKATEQAITEKEHKAIITSQAYVAQALKHPKWGPIIQKALDNNPGVLNPHVAVERWLRKISLNQDPNARGALQEITDQQRKLMRRLTHAELDKILDNPDRVIAAGQKSNIKFVFDDAGLMWTRTGELSKSSKMSAILQDSPRDPKQGMWNPSLDGYIKSSAKREDEEVQEDGHVSLDANYGEEGESTLAHTDLGDEIGKAARARHAKDPVAEHTAVSLGERRVAAAKHVEDTIAKLTPEQTKRVLLNARVVIPADLERFNVLLQTFIHGMQIEPHELQAFVRTHVPTKIKVAGKQIALPPGLGNWLIEGEGGSHTAWQSVGKTNTSTEMARCMAFCKEYVSLNADNMLVVNEKYENGQFDPSKVEQAKPVLPADEKGFLSPTPNYTDEEKTAAGEGRRAVTYHVLSDEQDQLAMGAHSWFTEYLKQSGMDPQTPLFKRYRDSMVRLALLMPQIDRARIGSIVKESGAVGKYGSTAGVMFSKSGLDSTGTFSKIKRFVGLLGEKYNATWVGTFVQNLVTAHEFNHVLFSAGRAGELGKEMSDRMEAAMTMVKSLTDGERGQILNSMRQFLLPKEINDGSSSEAIEIMRFLQHQITYGTEMGRTEPGGRDNPEEFMSAMFSMLGIGMSNPAESTKNLKNFERLRQFIPDRLRQFQEAYYTNLMQYTKAMRGFLNEYSETQLGDKYAQIVDIYQQLARTPKEVDAAMAALGDMERFQPEQFIQMANDARAPDITLEGLGTDKYSAMFGKDAEILYGIKPTPTTQSSDKFPYTQADANRSLQFGKELPLASPVDMARRYLTPSKDEIENYGHNPGFWSLFTPLAQFAERFPVMRPLADTLLSFDGMVNSANALVLSPFATRTVKGKIVKTENLDSLRRVTSSPQTHGLLNAMFLWQNEYGKLATEKDIARYGPGLSAQQRQDVLDTLTSMSQSMTTMGAQNIQTSLQMSGHLLGSFAMNMQKDMSAKNGEQIGANLMNALMGMQSKDPQAVEQAELLLGGVRMQLDPENWPHVLQLAQSLVVKHSQFFDNQSNRPFYTPETRPGEFGMYSERDGKPHFTSFKNESEALKERERLSKLSNVDKVRLINPYKNAKYGTQYSEAAVNHFVSLEQDAFKAAQQVFGGTPDGMEKMQEFAKLYSPGTAILDELASKGIRKNLQERKFVAGREDIDMLSNALNYINGMTRANAKNYIKSKTLLQSQDPTLVNEHRLKNLFFDHQNNVLNPPSQSLSALKHLTTMYYIGGNFSSAAMQAFQPIQATLPHLTRNGVGITQGLGYFASACKTLFNAYGRGKGIENDPVLQAAFNKATTERVVGFQNVMSNFDHFDDAFVSRVKNFANDSGDASITPAKLLQNVSYQTTRVLSYMFQHITEHNTRVGFIAGFNAARDQGRAKGLVGKDLSDYAYAEAKRTVEESLHTGGQASRPLGFGQVGKLYGVAGNLYALNHFNFSMISIIARYGLEALGRTGLEGAALHNARKAFGQSLVTQLALGGAMGLPFAGATVAMLEELFPNLQLNRDMRTAISGLAGDDHELGGFLADASLKGLATAVSPVDVSGRLGLSAVLGEDPYYGFEAKDLLGATGSMLYNMTKGVQQVASGDPSGLTKFMPNALQRMYQAAHDGGVQRNAQGQPIFDPTATERVLMAIGLRPKALSHVKEQSMIDERNQTIQSRELQSWYQQQESALTSGNYAAVKQALYQKAQEDPTFSPVIALKRIAAGAQKSQVVQSPVDKGSAAQLRSREAVGATFGQPTMSQQQPTQVQQLLQRSELERQVDIPGAGHVAQTELSQARLMDYLMQRYHLDDGQARQIISQMGQEKQPSYRSFHPGVVSPLTALAGQPAGQ